MQPSAEPTTERLNQNAVPPGLYDQWAAKNATDRQMPHGSEHRWAAPNATDMQRRDTTADTSALCPLGLLPLLGVSPVNRTVGYTRVKLATPSRVALRLDEARPESGAQTGTTPASGRA